MCVQTPRDDAHTKSVAMQTPVTELDQRENVETGNSFTDECFSFRASCECHMTYPMRSWSKT